MICLTKIVLFRYLSCAAEENDFLGGEREDFFKTLNFTNLPTIHDFAGLDDLDDEATAEILRLVILGEM